jgi:hypothetical protein
MACRTGHLAFARPFERHANVLAQLEQTLSLHALRFHLLPLWGNERDTNHG